MSGHCFGVVCHTPAVSVVTHTSGARVRIKATHTLVLPGRGVFTIHESMRAMGRNTLATSQSVRLISTGSCTAPRKPILRTASGGNEPARKASRYSLL